MPLLNDLQAAEEFKILAGQIRRWVNSKKITGLRCAYGVNLQRSDLLAFKRTHPREWKEARRRHDYAKWKVMQLCLDL